MKLHPRFKKLARAESDLVQAILAVLEKHDLTMAEDIQVTSAACHGHIRSLTRYAIRMERHGDGDKPGDQA